MAILVCKDSPCAHSLTVDWKHSPKEAAPLKQLVHCAVCGLSTPDQLFQLDLQQPTAHAITSARAIGQAHLVQSENTTVGEINRARCDDVCMRRMGWSRAALSLNLGATKLDRLCGCMQALLSYVLGH